VVTPNEALLWALDVCSEVNPPCKVCFGLPGMILVPLDPSKI
jgi:hypothetical protein